MNRNENSSKAAGGGVGFCGLLGLAFIILKLTHVIEWDWVWVLSPLWIPLAITAAFFVIILLVMLVKMTGKVVSDELRKK